MTSDIMLANHERNRRVDTHTRGSRRRADRAPVDPIQVTPGQSVKFLGDRRWWTVRAVGADTVVLTRTADFGRDGHYYTVVVWSQGRRGPVTSWNTDTDTDTGCRELVTAMEDGTTELSERSAIHLDIDTVRTTPRTTLLQQG